MKRNSMEASVPSIETQSPFPVHRKSHLESETFHTLARILSRCYDNPNIWDTSHMVGRLALTQENGSNAPSQATENETSGCLVPTHTLADNANCQPSFVNNNEFTDAQTVLDEMEHVPSTDKGGDLMRQNGNMVDHGPKCDEFLASSESYNEFQILLGEGEDMLNGSKIPICNKNVGFSIIPQEKSLNLSGEIQMLNDPLDEMEHVLSTDKGGDLMRQNGNMVDHGPKGDEFLASSESYNEFQILLGEGEDMLNGSKIPICDKNAGFSIIPQEKSLNFSGDIQTLNDPLDEMEHVLSTDKGGNLMRQNGNMVDHGSKGDEFLASSELYNEFQILLGEGEDMLNGSKRPTWDKNVGFSIIPQEKSLNFSGEIQMLNDPQVTDERPQDVREESGNASQLEMDCHCDLNASCAMETSSDVIGDAANPVEDKRSSLLETSMMEAEYNMHQKIVVEKLNCVRETNGFLNDMNQDGDVEEGEIFGAFEIDGESVNMILEDSVAMEDTKFKQMQVSEGIREREDSFCSVQIENKNDSPLNYIDVVAFNEGSFCAKEQYKGVLDNDIARGTPVVVFGENTRDKKVNPYGNQLERGVPFPGECPSDTSDDELSEEELEKNRAIEQDGNKKKRGPRSKEKKARKKKRERMNRAEKNRQLGVKRLKLKPQISKPKVVAHCRHYLNGRCHEGENCKYSHDVIPLTKSKPCGHFTRNTCMKGDDCPFDHQLSKYPCNSYSSTGFCSRGNDCKFSHKLHVKDNSPQKLGSTSVTSVPPALIRNLLSAKHLNSNGKPPLGKNVLPSAGDVCKKNIETNLVDKIKSPSSRAPKGIKFLAVGKSSIKSGEFRQHSPTPESDGTVHNLNELANTNSPLQPKGINFLCFGNSAIDVSSVKKQDQQTLSSNGEVKLANAGQQEQASSSSSNMIRKLNEMLKNKQPRMAPCKPPFPSLEENLLASFRKQVNLAPGVSDGLKQNSPDKHQITSSSPWKMPATCIPNSTQKAMLSTLAFAANLESETKSSKTTGVL